MRTGLIALSLLAATVSPGVARAQAAIGIHLGGPRVSIGVVMPVVAEWVQVPGEPVYYAPRASANYFFFDGFYWVFHEDRWYASAGYDGPWQLVAREHVPVYVLRVPVRYYRAPPAYFRGWHRDHSPRWGERWGRDWERRRAGWDRHDAPPPRPAAWAVPPRDGRRGHRPEYVERAVVSDRDHGRSRDDGHRGGSGGDHGREGGRGRDAGHARGGDDDRHGHARGDDRHGRGRD